jgi:LmbE family N-acetylglucosaminyl deacetylase
MLTRVFVFIIALLTTLFTYGQQPKTYSSSQIYQAVQKLNFLGTALYIAAHPDDENTQLISYLSNGVKAHTAYLSITRGDGGQNLIGPELRELLGVVRTEELLAARSIDGGKQFFTRANDFGYSKHPDETLEIWDKKEVLSDVVWVIRNFKPDVIINRFDHRSPGTTHGHHTASAMLSMEAFEKAGDNSLFKDQLKFTDSWQPKKIFFNTSWWFYGSEEKFKAADKSSMITVDVGTYYTNLGKSNNEIASVARSQHLSQGFGTLTTRGSHMEYLELLRGDLAGDQIFDGINTSWTRVEGGAEIEKILVPIEKNFNFVNPASHLSQLLEAYKLIKELKDDHWRELKLKQIKKIIAACSGLFIETTTDVASATPGSQIQIQANLINRSKAQMELSKITILPTKEDFNFNKTLKNNILETIPLDYNISHNSVYSNPYWLNSPSSLGMYQAPLELRGKARTPPAIPTLVTIIIDGVPIDFETQVVYKFVKPDKGELYQPFEILPKATVNAESKVMVFANQQPKSVSLSIKSGASGIHGIVSFLTPKGWKVSPSEQSFSLANKGEVKSLSFKVYPPKKQGKASITPVVKIGDESFSKELNTINYQHIPTQSVLLDPSIKVVRSDIKIQGKKIAYIMGAGDAVPESLEQIGYQVDMINPKDITSVLLNNYDAVVVGIRAYNVNKTLKFKQAILFDFVEKGGNLVVQYNTVSRNTKGSVNIAPYPLELSRERVTDENAKVNFIAPNHPILNTPNKITSKDFQGWVQERGLYFAGKWSKEFEPILSMNDHGESPKEGSILVATYGKGYYIYTGLSFFRELPAGVSGAYKLLANMLSIGKQDTMKLNSLNN